MLSPEALSTIIDLARRSHGPQVIKPSAEPAHVYHLLSPNGTATRHEAQPVPRAHNASTLEALAAVVRSHVERGAPVVVWYSRQGVVALLDDSTRRDRVTLPLPLHPQLATLQQLEASRPSLDQRKLVSTLRVALAGCVQGNLVEVVRRVKFRRAAEGESVIQHGKASLGRSLEAELTGAGTIPEQTTLHVPAFLGMLATRRYPVPCALEVDPATETFQLLPFPGAIDAALCAAEVALGEELAELLGENAPIYHGCP